METTPRAGGRIDDIEALRAIAILFTLLTHVNAIFPWGNEFVFKKILFFSFGTGVDLFLAVSGFVIARDLMKRFAAVDGREEWWRTLIGFWMRRAYRIWPTSWAWLIVIAASSVAFRDYKQFLPLHYQVADIAAAAMQVANIHLWQCMYAPMPSQCGNTAVWWSLSLEEQFYILLPFAMLIFRKQLPHFLAVVVLSQFFLHRPSFSPSFMWWIRTDAIALGVLIAIFERGIVHRLAEPKFMADRRYGAPVVMFLVTLLAIVAGSSTDKIDPVFFSTGLVALISAALVWIASYNKGYIVQSALIKPVVLWLGSRSFALYMVHTVTISFTYIIWEKFDPPAGNFTPDYTLRFVTTWLVLTIALSEFNYRFIETPLRRKGRLIADRFERGLANPPRADESRARGGASRESSGPQNEGSPGR